MNYIILLSSILTIKTWRMQLYLRVLNDTSRNGRNAKLSSWHLKLFQNYIQLYPIFTNFSLDEKFMFSLKSTKFKIYSSFLVKFNPNVNIEVQQTT